MSRDDAQKDVDASKIQIENDEKFIKQTATSLEEKKQECTIELFQSSCSVVMALPKRLHSALTFLCL